MSLKYFTWKSLLEELNDISGNKSLRTLANLALDESHKNVISQGISTTLYTIHFLICNNLVYHCYRAYRDTVYWFYRASASRLWSSDTKTSINSLFGSSSYSIDPICTRADLQTKTSSDVGFVKPHGQGNKKWETIIFWDKLYSPVYFYTV